MRIERAVTGELMATHWFLIRTPPAKEPAAAHVLKQKGFEVYCPMKQVWRRVTKHNKRRSAQRRLFALFPGYVFIGLSELTPDGEELRDTPFVTSLVTIDGVNPAEIRPKVVEELRSRFGELTTGPKFHRWIAGNPFGPGDLVELVGEVHPSLRGVAFEVEQIRGRSAVLISKLFGGMTIVAGLDNLERHS